MTATYSRITGTGSFLPPRRVSNQDLVDQLVARGLESSDDWIVERTGIRARHFVDDGVNSSDLALAACRHALEAAGRRADEVDLIIVATSTPDMVFPSTAAILQHKLGVAACPAFDMQAVCSGFIFALTTADQYIRTGFAKTILVIGAETFSRLLDWNDRTTCVLFGDGAGAVVVSAVEGEGTSQDRGILSSHLRSDGAHRDKLYVDGGPSTTGTVGHLRMEGREVFRHAVGMITDVIEAAYEATGMTSDDIDWFIPHQANKRIIDASAKKLHIAPEKVVITVDRHGNTSAASIPLALCEAVRDGRVKRGDIVLLEAMGGGFTWGSVLLRW